MKQQTVVVKEIGQNKEYQGFYKAPPTIGKNFYLMALDMYDDNNYLTTVEVSSVQKTPYGWKFRTESGKEYEVHVSVSPNSQKIGRA